MAKKPTRAPPVSQEQETPKNDLGIHVFSGGFRFSETFA
jgi:hypothetical protein